MGEERPQLARVPGAKLRPSRPGRGRLESDVAWHEVPLDRVGEGPAGGRVDMEDGAGRQAPVEEVGVERVQVAGGEPLEQHAPDRRSNVSLNLRFMHMLQQLHRTAQELTNLDSAARAKELQAQLEAMNRRIEQQKRRLEEQRRATEYQLAAASAAIGAQLGVVSAIVSTVGSGVGSGIGSAVWSAVTGADATKADAATM